MHLTFNSHTILLDCVSDSSGLTIELTPGIGPVLLRVEIQNFRPSILVHFGEQRIVQEGRYELHRDDANCTIRVSPDVRVCLCPLAMEPYLPMELSSIGAVQYFKNATTYVSYIATGARHPLVQEDVDPLYADFPHAPSRTYLHYLRICLLRRTEEGDTQCIPYLIEFDNECGQAGYLLRNEEGVYQISEERPTDNYAAAAVDKFLGIV